MRIVGTVTIDTSKIPEIEKYLIGMSAYDGLMAHFNNPENQKRFKAWLAKRKRKQKETLKESTATE